MIYAGTFSKPFATGARVGYGILPGPLFAAVKHIKGNHDFGTANLLQHLFAHALASGVYGQHVARLQKRYAHKARVMKRAIEKHFPPAVEWWEPEGGLYFWARLPRHIPAGMKSKVFQAALKNDVLYVPGELCYADDPARRKPDHEMRISFGSASEADIREGIRRLGTVLRAIVAAKMSPRRPGHVASAQDVDVQVRHALAAVLAVVDDQPVAAFVQSQFGRHFGGLEQQVAEQLVVFRLGLGQARDGFFGNHQNVLGRLGIDVAQREHQVVFINDGRGNFPRDDFFKQCLAHNL